MFAVEYIESLRFERANDDGTKTVFSVEEPKSIGLTNPRSILTGKYGGSDWWCKSLLGRGI